MPSLVGIPFDEDFAGWLEQTTSVALLVAMTFRVVVRQEASTDRTIRDSQLTPRYVSHRGNSRGIHSHTIRALSATRMGPIVVNWRWVTSGALGVAFTTYEAGLAPVECAVRNAML